MNVNVLQHSIVQLIQFVSNGINVKFLVNTLFLFRSLTSRISNKEFRETLLMDPLLN